MTVYLARREAVTILTLNRQDVLNAPSFAMLREIGDAIDQVAQSDARALIVTGAGPKAFCVDADTKELRGRSLLGQKRGSELGQGVFAKLDALPVPSIAVINGHAFDGGFEFARAAVRRAADLPLSDGLKAEAELSTLAYRTAGAEEDMAAFVEKRKPEFRDA